MQHIIDTLEVYYKYFTSMDYECANRPAATAVCGSIFSGTLTRFIRLPELPLDLGPEYFSGQSVSDAHFWIGCLKDPLEDHVCTFDDLKARCRIEVSGLQLSDYSA